MSLFQFRGPSVGLGLSGFTNKQLCDLGKKDLSSLNVLFSPRVKNLRWKFYKISSNSTTPWLFLMNLNRLM